MVARLWFFFFILLIPAISLARGIAFSAMDLNGKVHHLSEYQGKWVVVNYWATWCPPCLDEIPELVDFHNAHSKIDAVVLGVNYEDTDVDYLRSFVEEYRISYPILKGDLKHSPPFGKVVGLPTTFIISPEGVLVNTRVGRVSREWIQSVMQQKPQH